MFFPPLACSDHYCPIHRLGVVMVPFDPTCQLVELSRPHRLSRRQRVRGGFDPQDMFGLSGGVVPVCSCRERQEGWYVRSMRGFGPWGPSRESSGKQMVSVWPPSTRGDIGGSAFSPTYALVFLRRVPGGAVPDPGHGLLPRSWPTHRVAHALVFAGWCVAHAPSMDGDGCCAWAGGPAALRPHYRHGHRGRDRAPEGHSRCLDAPTAAPGRATAAICSRAARH